jgi:predicted ATPase
MTKTVEINNFRGFKSAELQNCKRLNVIVGANGSGKTALLEAFFLAAGSSAEIALRARQWRGFDAAQTSGTTDQLDDALWGDLFYNFDRKAKLSIALHGTPAHEVELKVKFLPQQEVLVPLPTRRNRDDLSPKVETFVQTAGVSFDWAGPYRRKVVSVARLEDGKLRFSSSNDPAITAAFFAASVPYATSETAIRFSELSKRMEVGEVVRNFREMFPGVEDVSMELSGGAPMLFAKIESQQRKIPLNLLSAGMTKLSALLFAIPSLENGMILIDEIENGFYYKILPAVWKAIYEFSVRYNVQVFASTHSQECLNAAGKIAQQHEPDFSLIRVQQGKSGSELHQFSGSEFTAAIDADVEIR